MTGIEFVMMRRYSQLSAKAGRTSVEDNELAALTRSLIEYREREIQQQPGQPLRPPLAKGAH